MKKSRFTEEQIAYALKQAELGMAVGDLSQAGYRGGDVLCVAQEIRRVGSIGAQASAAAGRRKPQAQAAGGGPEPG